jgi:hypothetical protein
MTTVPTHSRNLIKKTNQTWWFGLFGWYTNSWHYQGKVPWHSIAQHALPFNHFHPNSWSAQISKLGCTRKKSRAIFDPANSSLFVPQPPLKVRSRKSILPSKWEWAHCNLHI